MPMRWWVLALLIPLSGCVDEAPQPSEPPVSPAEPVAAPRDIQVPYSATASASVVVNGLIYEMEEGTFRITGPEAGADVHGTFSWACANVVCPLVVQLRDGNTVLAEGEGMDQVELRAEGLDSKVYQIMAWSADPGVAVEVVGRFDATITPPAD